MLKYSARDSSLGNKDGTAAITISELRTDYTEFNGEDRLAK